MQEAHNIDSTLVQAMSDQMAGNPPPVPEVQAPTQQAQPEPQEAAPAPEQAEAAPLPQAEPEKHDNSDENKSAESSPQQASDSPIDEYGNPIAPKKMYTEDEFNQRLNEAVRDRMSRGRFAEEQPTNQERKQAEADGFKADPNSEESWDVQLAKFIDNRLDQREKEAAERQYRARAQQAQAEFETRFNSGMAKYPDFQKVVSGKPITPRMMMAISNLADPAAFLYGAFKMHPAEVERMAQTDDPGVLVGMLHERMVKERNRASAAPKPIEAPAGSLPNKASPQPSIEDRIHSYARNKRK